MPTVSNPQKLLLPLFVLVVVALGANSSGGVRFGGDEDGGSGFGGTGRAPTGGSGLGGTGLKPLLGDAGEVRIRFEPDATVIAGQVAEEDIRRIPQASEVLPPVAVVTAPEFAAEHSAKVAITDSIQLQLQRDAVIYERILESVEGYYPPDIDRATLRPSAPERAAERKLTAAPPQDAAVEVVAAPAVAPAPTPGEAVVSDAMAGPARITWAELTGYLMENGAATEANEALAPEAAENPDLARRPDRIRRPELPQVQRGRVIQRPAILPPRVQPMHF